MDKRRKGEDGILDLIDRYFPNAHPCMPAGRGDDCALIAVPPAGALGSSPVFAVTSDIFAENAHFRTAYFTAADIGHKALAVNISDLAANGAEPCAFAFNLTLTEKQDFAWLEECCQSMAALAREYGLVLCGGDLTKVPLPKAKNGGSLDPLTCGGLNLGITAWGTYGHGGVPLMRHRSYAGQNRQAAACMAAGDVLFYVGEIGLARAGLFLLEENLADPEAGRKAVLAAYPQAAAAHLRPLPKVREGLLLSEFAKEHALFVMDISDGLMRDVPRILAREGLVQADEPSFGAELVLTEDAVHPEVRAYCRKKGLDPVHFAYKGGEDYGLLGVCAGGAFARFAAFCREKDIALRRLGTVTPCGTAVTLNGKTMEEAGFDHFQ